MQKLWITGRHMRLLKAEHNVRKSIMHDKSTEGGSIFIFYQYLSIYINR